MQVREKIPSLSMLYLGSQLKNWFCLQWENKTKRKHLSQLLKHTTLSPVLPLFQHHHMSNLQAKFTSLFITSSFSLNPFF